MLSTTTRGLIAASLIAATGGAFAQTAFSQAAETRIDNREARQETRIEQGIQSGALTKPETRSLGRQQARIERSEYRAEADGKVTPKEAARIEQRQDRASAHIARAKHDGQTRK